MRMVPGRLVGHQRALNPGRFRRVIITTCSFAVTRRETVSLSFTAKTTSPTGGVSDDAVYSSTEDGSEEDEYPWIPHPLSLPSEDPTEG